MQKVIALTGRDKTLPPASDGVILFGNLSGIAFPEVNFQHVSPAGRLPLRLLRSLRSTRSATEVARYTVHEPQAKNEGWNRI